MKAFEIEDRRRMEVEDQCSDEMPRKKLCKETNKIDHHHDINPGLCREDFPFWKHLLPKLLPVCLLPNRVCSLSNPGPSFLTPTTYCIELIRLVLLVFFKCTIALVQLNPYVQYLLQLAALLSCTSSSLCYPLPHSTCGFLRY